MRSLTNPFENGDMPNRRLKSGEFNRLVESVLTMLFVLLSGTSVSAQYADASSSEHPFELIPHVGYAWTGARSAGSEFDTGELDIEDSEYFGIIGDYTVRPGGQVRLQYRRQDTDLVYRGLTLGKVSTDVAVEYFQLGGLAGVERGKFFPYGSFTLGATRFSASDFDEDDWKFSMLLGFGVKAYGGDRIGFMFQGTFPFTIMEGGGAIAVGPAGGFATFGGSGIGQFDLTGGLIIRI
jgi:hypothetical protein